MKATLEFNLPDDSEEFDNACRATATKDSIEEFRTWLRNVVKYTEKDKWPDAEQILEKHWDFLARRDF